MNTPSPCDKCVHCKWDILREEDPLDSAWCEFELLMGVEKCPKLEVYGDE